MAFRNTNAAVTTLVAGVLNQSSRLVDYYLSADAPTSFYFASYNPVGPVTTQLTATHTLAAGQYAGREFHGSYAAQARPGEDLQLVQTGTANLAVDFTAVQA